MRRFGVAVIALGLAALSGSSRAAETPLLNAIVGTNDGFNITLNDGTGRKVDRLLPGTYTVVVDDRSAVRELVKAAGGRLLPGPFLDFLDPWGNRVEVVDYADIQFTKAPHVLRGMGLDLGKNEGALRELTEKGMAP